MTRTQYAQFFILPHQASPSYRFRDGSTRTVSLRCFDSKCWRKAAPKSPNQDYGILETFSIVIGNVGKYAAAWYQRTSCLAGSILIRWGKLRKCIPDRHTKRCGKPMGQWGNSFRKWYCINIYILYTHMVGKTTSKHLIFLRVLSGWRCFLQAQIDLKNSTDQHVLHRASVLRHRHRHGMMAQPSMSFIRLYKYYQKTWDVSKSSQKAGTKWRMSMIHQDQSVISRVIHQTVWPHWGVLTVGVKAGAWSGCSSWAAVFFL
jgi:hypothetical protein